MTEDQPRYHHVGFAAALIPDSGINGLRFSACEDLLDEGRRLVDETGRSPISGAKRLLAVQAARATHSFESVIALCRIGRGVQAAMINRSLLEDALDVHWVPGHDHRQALRPRQFRVREAMWVGDYQALATTQGAFHPLWNVTRTGRLQLYTAAVRVS
jgi:hypothetical protein